MASAHLGVGARSGVPVDEVLALIEAVLREAGLRRADVRSLATLDARAAEPGITGAAEVLGVPVRGFTAEELAGVPVPHPSALPLAATGTASVAEAAALLAAAAADEGTADEGAAGEGTAAAGGTGPTGGAGGLLLVPKRKTRRVTCALAASVPFRPNEDAPGVRLLRRTHGYIAGEPGSPPTIPTPHTTAAMDMHLHTDAHDLRHHGDAEVRDEKLIDLAVNVRTNTPPDWLRRRIADSLTGLAAYPDGRAARAAVAERHDLPSNRVLLTAGAAEAFVLIARALPVRRPVVVHPQFTEPEAALSDVGHEVGRVLLREEDGFRLDPAAVPEDADLVVIGNPTNPTSVLHPADSIAALARPGRTLVVDEAFIDAVPGERESLAGRTDVPGLVVLRSLTKTWGLAGLRIGYVLAEPETIVALERSQPLWPVSTPALVAAEACMSRAALAEAEHAAHRIGVERAHLLAGLAEFDEVRTVEGSEGPFVLLRIDGADAIRERLRSLGFAARRGDTFPGLDRNWLRIAVRDRVTTNRFLQALDQALLMGG
ncbi:Rv2231c family pyridoxal phosphate-dependent protein CobC [Streptomyces sp. NBC_00572]|uniref:Rv2231c family pyridoxal phosphate-dependent protein CobC n=1 Tax=Streptomyces sp. NBC_00572 TaxID=2903664 RepID=UPI002250801B|nr:Rv2231c family pyridoxal phosphate-dependent protein CobC [Streptomyces sp. NBC_00572]MCX4980111.1 Rv2231c family pyridoxal phosphate-dependent protein CobC [Streptomyces sp. NBC_00572]